MANIWIKSSDGDIDAVKQFIAEGGDANTKDEYGYTPLQAAVSYSHVDLVQYLIASGASVTLADNDLDTPLHRAESAEVAKILLQHGAELNARNSEGKTPFDSAIEEEHTELIALYESLGAEKSDGMEQGEEELGQWSEEMES